MGYFFDGRLYEWGNPLALLRFPGVSLLSRLRYGLLAFVSTRRDRWDALEPNRCLSGSHGGAAPKAYQRLWKPLLKLKFHEFADNFSPLGSGHASSASGGPASRCSGGTRLHRGRKSDAR